MRKLDDWIDAFVDYGMIGEAPMNTLFWSGVSAVAGALGRKVWLDQVLFRWYANMYIVIVAKPGIIAKTTTADLSMELLHQCPGVTFGPNIVTWPALVDSFEEAVEVVEYSKGFAEETCSLTICSGEFGNFLPPGDREMIDLLVTLWDCKDLKKRTKKDGVKITKNPFLNLLACTTPGWISGNIPAYMIDGGLVSRVIWVYGDTKRQFVAYPGRTMAKLDNNRSSLRHKLIDDLRVISEMRGEFVMTPEAITWGEAWYEQHWTDHGKGKDDNRFEGYMARKQTHLHKLAMILAASRGSDYVIELKDLQRAEGVLSAVEPNMPVVFDRIGRSETSNQVDRLMEHIDGSDGIDIGEAYRYVRNYFPRYADFDSVVKGLMKGGLVALVVKNGRQVLVRGKQS